MSLDSQPKRILVVEDENEIRQLIVLHLKREGYLVDEVADGERATRLLTTQNYQLVILDWMLPGMSGLEITRWMRSRKELERTSVLFVTAKVEPEHIATGLDAGADDYLVKPYAFAELIARVGALLRRASPQLVASVLKAGDLELDRQSHRVRRAGREVHLGPTEYRLLEHLMRHPGRVYSREQLLDGVWGNDVYVDERTVDVHVGRLRKAINRGRSADPIRTVRGAGYAFDEQFAAG